MKSFRNALVCQLFIISCFTGICQAVNSRPLDEGEKYRLYSAWERNRNRMTLPIDVTFSEKTINSPTYTELRAKQRRQKNEETRKDPKKANREVKSAGFLSADKEEVFLYQLRVQINGFSKYRADLIVFGDEKKGKKTYDAVHISNNETSFNIDKKRKHVSIEDGVKWGASRDTLTYGTFVDQIKMTREIIRLCRPNRVSATDDVNRTTREFRHNGIVKIAGMDTVAIELFDLNNKHSIYKIFLDVNDWGRCYRLVLYNEDGTCERRISEFSNFQEDKTSGILYPRLIVKKYFYDDGKEKKRDIINIQKVSIGLLLPDDVFELNVSDDYSITDRRMDPVLQIPAKPKSEEPVNKTFAPDNSLEIISVVPNSPAILELGEKLYVDIRYQLRSFTDVQIWARPYIKGRRASGSKSHGSRVYHKTDSETGIAKGSFYFNKPTTIDEIRVNMKDKNTEETQTASYKIDARWIDVNSVNTAGQTLNTKQYDHLTEERQIKGKTMIPGTYTWDIEKDKLGGSTGADLWWQQVNSRERYLVPRNGAKISRVLDKDFETVDLQYLKKVKYSHKKISGSDDFSVLAPGAVIALKTLEGNLAKIKVIGIERKRQRVNNIKLEWVLFRNSSVHTQQFEGETENTVDVKKSN